LTTSKELVSINFNYKEGEYEDNLTHLLSLIKRSSPEAIICAPELCLTNFSFSSLKEAGDFSKEAIERIFEVLEDRVFSFSILEERDGKFYNTAKILHKGEIIHSQDKVKLFKFGDEDKYYEAGDIEKVKIVEINGLRFAILICFEIRFIELWELIKGADIIMIPSLWGKLRKSHYEAITKALAILNQAFVIASNSTQEDMASSGGVITPFGDEYRDDTKEFISLQADLREIKKLRRYMDIGLK
jgi:predicted amidohydrolase